MAENSVINEERILEYLASKSITKNTYDNYLYDLRAFASFMEERDLTKTNLDIYRQKLLADGLSQTAAKRKISAINQFLKYSYNTGNISQYLQLEQVKVKKVLDDVKAPQVVKLPDAYGQIESVGQFIALLIIEFGLTPTEIQSLSWRDFDWNFKILSLTKNGFKRIIPMSNKFILISRSISNGDELFSKSRQFLYYELKKYTHLTAQELREQYILRQVNKGTKIHDLAGKLGLTTTATLEKYYKNE